MARRITSHSGRELFPKFSPDGKWIAFTRQYDGNYNVYLMPSEGGQPKQLTFYQGSPHPLNGHEGNSGTSQKLTGAAYGLAGLSVRARILRQGKPAGEL